MLWYLAAIVALLFLSGLFSGSETALFSLTRTRRDRLKETDPKTGRRVEGLLAKPVRLLGTILFSNLLVNVTATALFTLAIISWTRQLGYDPTVYLGIGGVVMTGVLLVFGEVTPKVMATHRPESFVRFTSGIVTGVQLILSPAALVLAKLSSALAPRSGEPECLTEEELRTMIKVGRERGVIVEREEEILWNLVGLEERTVSEVMTPRIDMVGLEKRTPIKEAVEVCLKAGRSRLPVYDGTVDSVIGIAYAKELLTAPDNRMPVETIVRPAYFVPEVKGLPPLLEELRRKSSHIAVVVDEFGQTAGLVTLEDVLEAIFGEITDEFDATEELPYLKIDKNNYVVDGEIDIATLNRLFRGVFDGIEHERLSGYVHERLGRLPAQGDRVKVNGLEIVVQEVDSNKLEKVLIRRTKAEGQGRMTPPA